MASSMAAVSRRMYRSLLSNPKSLHPSMSFCTNLSSHEDASELDGDGLNAPDLESDSSPPSAASNSDKPKFTNRPLENGLDVGVYKAILVGQVGQTPVQKRLKGGSSVTLLSVGTGGIRNNRRPLSNEEPTEYAKRSTVQWHRVSVYPEKLGQTVMSHAKVGSIVYLEGNLETKIFSDPITGLVRRIREVALRRNGRIVFLGNENGNNHGDTQPTELRRVGYY